MGQLPSDSDQINNFLKFQQRQFEMLLQIQEDKLSMQTDTIDNDFKIKPEGHLVFLNCGHRGQPDRLEEKRISRLMRKA